MEIAVHPPGWDVALGRYWVCRPWSQEIITPADAEADALRVIAVPEIMLRPGGNAVTLSALLK